MPEVTISAIDKKDVKALYCHYPSQDKPQPSYMQLSLEDGQMLCSYDPVIGSGVPGEVYNSLVLRWKIPSLTPEAANKLMEEVKPLAAQILADSGTGWSGSDRVGVLGDKAREASNEIDALCEQYRAEEAFTGDFVQGTDAYDWFSYGSRADITKEYGVTRDTTDEQLKAMAAGAEQEALESGSPGPCVLSGALEYFESLRSDLRSADAT